MIRNGFYVTTFMHSTVIVATADIIHSMAGLPLWVAILVWVVIIARWLLSWQQGAIYTWVVTIKGALFFSAYGTPIHACLYRVKRGVVHLHIPSNYIMN